MTSVQLARGPRERQACLMLYRETGLGVSATQGIQARWPGYARFRERVTISIALWRWAATRPSVRASIWQRERATQEQRSVMKSHHPPRGISHLDVHIYLQYLHGHGIHRCLGNEALWRVHTRVHAPAFFSQLLGVTFSTGLCRRLTFSFSSPYA